MIARGDHGALVRESEPYAEIVEEGRPTRSSSPAPVEATSSL